MKNLLLILCFLVVTLTCHAQLNTTINNNQLIDFYQTQRYAEALAYLKGAYHEPFTDIRALQQLAYSAFMAGRLTDADQYYQRIYTQDSTNKAALYNLASLNLRRGNVIKARQYFEQIVKADTTNFMAYKQLARLSKSQLDIGAYVAYLQKANHLDPAEVTIAADLSDFYVSLKQNAAAQKVLDAALAADSTDILLLQSYIRLTYAEKKWNDALRACKQLVQLGDRSAFTLIKLGECYYRLKDYQHSLETFTAIDEGQQNETSYYYTAMCYKKLQNNDMAAKCLLLAIKDGISPSVSTYYGELAGTYQAQKKYGQSAVAYQRGLTFEANPLLYYSLANLYDEMKDKKSTIKYYRKYLATQPGQDQLSYINYAKSRLNELKN